MVPGGHPAPTAGALTVKYIIGADVHHFDVQTFADLSDISRSICIDFTAEFHVLFRCGVGQTPVPLLQGNGRMAYVLHKP